MQCNILVGCRILNHKYIMKLEINDADKKIWYKFPDPQFNEYLC